MRWPERTRPKARPLLLALLYFLSGALWGYYLCTWIRRPITIHFVPLPTKPKAEKSITWRLPT